MGYLMGCEREVNGMYEWISWMSIPFRSQQAV